MAALGFKVINILLLLICMVSLSTVDAAARPLARWRKLSALVEEEPLVLEYHNGPLFTTSPILNLHLIWYGNFTSAQRAIVGDFVQSLAMGDGKQATPSVSAWWKTTEAYKGSAPSQSNQAQPLSPSLGKQKLDEGYSLGKSLKRSDIAVLVKSAIESRDLPPPEKKNSNGEVELYLVLTSEDVMVENFCSSSCGFHGSSRADIEYAYAPSAKGNGKALILGYRFKSLSRESQDHSCPERIIACKSARATDASKTLKVTSHSINPWTLGRALNIKENYVQSVRVVSTVFPPVTTWATRNE